MTISSFCCYRSFGFTLISQLGHLILYNIQILIPRCQSMTYGGRKNANATACDSNYRVVAVGGRGKYQRTNFRITTKNRVAIDEKRSKIFHGKMLVVSFNIV